MRRSRDVILAEAARWHIDQQGGLTGEQDEALSRWLRADPQHAVAFAEVGRTWSLAAALDGAALPAAKVGERGVRPLRWLAAAAVAGFLASGIGYLTMQPKHYATAIGEIRAVTLADGSRVTLNTASELEISFTRNRRNVRLLRGEAMFEVAKDRARPFVVAADGASMQAVGTIFDVRSERGKVELTVAEGIVKFQPVKARRDSDRATDATSGKIDRTRIRRTVGQMKSHLAAPSERHASRVEVARRVARCRRADPEGTGSSGIKSSELSLDAKTRDVGGQLTVPSGLVRYGIPAIGDGLLGAGGVELLREVLRDGRVEDVLLIPLGLGDAHVEDHVLVLQAGLDGTKVVRRRRLAQTGIGPRLDVLEMRGPVRVVAGLAQRHVDAGDGR